MGIFLSYLSAHPPRSILLSVAENELRRAIRIRRSNTDEGGKRGLKKISDLLRENDYPEKIVERSCHKVKQRTDVIVEKVNENDNGFLWSRNILKLYYIDEQRLYLKRKLLKELKNNKLITEHTSNTRVIFIPGPNLS